MQQTVTRSLYLHCVCNGLGEFGRVYKGTWIYKNASGNTISETVAVKTVKGTQLCGKNQIKTHSSESYN